MTSWTLEEKRAMKEYEKIIKGNEAKVLAIYQALPYQRLAYSPKDLQKLLNSLEDQSPSSKDWTTLEQQITDVWKSRGLEVLDIKVDDKGHGYWKWIISAKEKEK